MLTLFSFGYWGWGTKTKQLVKLVDRSEANLGYKPPLWVDIRYQRGVRAPGFRDDALKDMVGEARYFWMKELGNRNVGLGRPGIKVDNPRAVGKLLDITNENSRKKRRAIFFCACQLPDFHGGRCHRFTVASYLIREARRNENLLQVVEWPGGKFQRISCGCDDSVFRPILNGRRTLPIRSLRNRISKTLAYGSVLELKNSNNDKLCIMSGPATLQKEWLLPIFEIGRIGEPASKLARSAIQFRKRNRLEPLTNI